MNIYKLTEELILGSRLKRIGDKFLSDISKIYKSKDIPFEPSWFPLFYLLDKNDKLKITDIAMHLEVSGSAVSQMISSLEKKELIICGKDKMDKRSKSVFLSESGRELLITIKPIWESIKYSIKQVLNEGENSINLLNSLSELENSLNEKDIYTRIEDELHYRSFLKDINITTYDKRYHSEFKSILLEWMINSGQILSPVIVESPIKYTTDNRSSINLAIAGNNLIGVLITEETGNLIIIKCLEVDSSFRNMGVENHLLNFCKEQFPDKKTTITLDLTQNDTIHLCKNSGFKLIEITKENMNNRSKIVLGRD